MRTRIVCVARGFTLIEIMVSLAIVGVLSSVAIPEYSRATVRSRSAERATIMRAIYRSINEVVTNTQRVPSDPVPGSGVWNGVANPPGLEGTTKRRFDWTLTGWVDLPMVVEGDAYYTYSFIVSDPPPTGTAVAASITAVGDLDGDGNPSTRTDAYTAPGYSFQPDPALSIPEDPYVF